MITDGCVKVLLAVLLACFCGGQGVALAASDTRVLLISSYHPGFPTFFQQIDGVRSVLEPEGVKLDVEFMDSKRFKTPANLNNFYQSLAYKLRNLPPYDVVLTTDDNALEFMLKYSEELVPGIPLVFCGVNNVDVALAQNGQELITGVIESVSIHETLEAMRSLFPVTRTLVVISDGTPSGMGDLYSVRSQLALQQDMQLEELLLSELSFTELGERLSKLGDDTVVLLLSAYVDRNNEHMEFESSLRFITAHLSRPLFHLWEHGMGEGVLGGKLVSHFEQGKYAAQIAMRILKGERPGSIMVVPGNAANVLTFDYKQLVRFGVAKHPLVAGAAVINRPVEKALTSESCLWLFLFVALVLSGGIFLVLVYNRKARNATRAYEQSLVRAKLFMKYFPLALVVLGKDSGTHAAERAPDLVEQVNDAFAELVGGVLSAPFHLLDVVADDEKENVQSWLAQEDIASSSLETLLAHASGATVAVRITAAASELQGQVLVLQDASDSETLRILRKDCEQRIRSVGSVIQEGLLILDKDSTVLLCNGQGAACLGAKKPEELVGRPLLEVVNPTLGRQLLDECTATFSSGTPVRWEDRAVLVCDDTRCHMACVPLLAEAGGRKEVLIVLADTNRSTHLSAIFA